MSVYIHIITFFAIVFGHDIKGFDDSVILDINWAGELPTNLEPEKEHMIVMTADKEQYQCVLPKVELKEEDSSDAYKGPSPAVLLAPLFSLTTCTYKLDSYWRYEICHGKYVRQYHEESEGNKVKLQEYYLGKLNTAEFLAIIEDVTAKNSDANVPIPTTKIDGISIPYFEVMMGNGTLCDINNKPRTVRMLYVCYIHGKHETFSLKETSTCNYEIIILSPLLCTHPKYKVQETGESLINCYNVGNGSNKPRALMELRGESLRLRKKRAGEDDPHVRVEIHPASAFDDQEVASEPTADTSPVQNFLSGKNCLHGGTGWWKYEFCYGKHVEQYHVEGKRKKTVINLGKFDRDKHIEWLRSNPHKRPKFDKQPKQLSHFYSDGDICDKSGRPRQTEVKLKCLDNTMNMGAVSLYLLEPRHCEYILGVESPLICEVFSKVDENGLTEGDAVTMDSSITK